MSLTREQLRLLLRPPRKSQLRQARQSADGSGSGEARRKSAGRRPTGKRGRMPAVPERTIGRPELIERRDRLAREFVELQWDIGGLTYEMASRDHFRLDVHLPRGAQLQAIDAELGEVERVLRLEQAGAAGSCPGCGALHARGAVYCWQCGKELIERGPVAGPSPPPAPVDPPPGAAPGGTSMLGDASHGEHAP
jgi:hypothetical protein